MKNLFVGLVVLAVAFVAVSGIAEEKAAPVAEKAPAVAAAADVITLTGKIAKVEEKLVLKTADCDVALPADAKDVDKFVGKDVKITGKGDKKALKSIDKIEEVPAAK